MNYTISFPFNSIHYNPNVDDNNDDDGDCLFSTPPITIDTNNYDARDDAFFQMKAFPVTSVMKLYVAIQTNLIPAILVGLENNPVQVLIITMFSCLK